MSLFSATTRPIFRQYTAIAKEYRQGTKQNFDSENYKRMLDDWVKLPQNLETILDIGCGEGTPTQFLKSEYNARKVIGIDASAAMISLAREDYNDVDFRVEGMEKLSLNDRSVDFVFGRFAIHYSYDLRKTLSEVARVTKPGGLFFLQDVHPLYALFFKHSLDYGMKEQVTFAAQCDDAIELVHPSFTFEEYLNAFSMSGWKLKSTHEIYGRDASGKKITPYRVPTSICFVLARQD